MPLSTTDSVPEYVSPEQHRELSNATPASFSSMPTVLRLQEPNVSLALDPPMPSVNADDFKLGTLFVLESFLVFMSSTSGKGVQVDYPTITLHAISRGESGPSIYCQLDDSDPTASDGDEDTMSMREMIIVPQRPEALEQIFESLSYCASLHPDPPGSDDEPDAFLDGDAADNFEVFTGDGDQELSAVGRAALAHLESIIYDPNHPDPGDEEGSVNKENENGEEPKVNGANGA